MSQRLKQGNIHSSVGRIKKNKNKQKLLNDTTSQNSEDKCLIKMKKYKALFFPPWSISPLLGDNLFSKGLKQEKYILQWKQNMCVVSIYVGYCWLYWIEWTTSRSGPAHEVRLWQQGRWRGGGHGGGVWRWEVEAAVAEWTSVQGIGVTASRPLDFLNVLQDHVM